MVRILHIVTYMGRGGLETMLMNYYRHIDRSQLQFDFLVHRDFRADYDDEIESLGGQIFHTRCRKYKLLLIADIFSSSLPFPLIQFRYSNTDKGKILTQCAKVSPVYILKNTFH